MRKRRARYAALVLAIVLLLAGIALTQTESVSSALRSAGYDLTWWTVDSGGGTMSGSGYELTGTAGQPDAGPALNNGRYTLFSGFWAGPREVPPACPVPLTGVSVSGPVSGLTGETLVFSATVQPATATAPISYTWSTDGLLGGQDTPSATYRWSSAGDKTVQVTARNCGGQDFGDSQSVSITAADDGTCANPLPLACGQQVAGNTVGRAGNIPSYTCSGWNESGPESIYAFSLGTGGTYTVSAGIGGMPVDLDVFLLSDCGAGQCLTPSSYGNFAATASEVVPGTYYVAVDGYYGVAGPYTLTLTCTPAGICDQPLTGVHLSGPPSGAADQDLVFTASPIPGGATGPIIYTWSTDGLVSGQGTASATYRWGSFGSRSVQVTARNCGGEDFSDSQLVDIGLGCAEVTGVDLTVLTAGKLFTDTVVAFSADITPESAEKPYSYTIDFDDGHSLASTSSADPLVAPLSHTFDTVGTYDVTFKAWNCDMMEGEATVDSVHVEVVAPPPPCEEVTGVTLSLITTGDIFTDTVVSFSADVAPDNATKPYTYSIDYSDGYSVTSASSEDPLTTPLDHTFVTSSTYDVEILVWNCEMAEGEAAQGSAQLIVKGYGPADRYVYLPLVVRND
jgi:hypothetical protein